MRDLFYIEKRAIQSAKFFELEKDSQRYENHTHAYANGARWMAGIKDAELEASRQECERLREFIKDLPTITMDMKAVCIGEFQESIELTDEDGEEYLQKVMVGWDTTKDIYTMMLKTKLTTKSEGGRQDE